MDTTEQSLTLTKVVFGVSILYYITRSIYRLFFHPLAKVPGPWYAAISPAWEFYWDCLQSGNYWTKINEMHAKYGPIVRINPWEVHINDFTFVDTLYGNSKLDKDSFFYGSFGVSSGAFSTVAAKTHRMRREPMAPFFTKANVRKLEPRVLARVRQLCGRIAKLAADDQPFCIGDAYRCVAADIVTDYALPETKTLLSHPDFASKWVRSIRDMAVVINWSRHIPIIMPLLVSLPRAMVAVLDREGAITGVIDMKLDVYAQAKLVTEGRSTKETPTVMNAIFASKTLSKEERSHQRIADESQSVMSAGTETTGNTLSLLTYFVLTNPRILQTLKSELGKAAAEHNIARTDFLDCSVVESLPYLQALMKETLRYGTPVSGRMPRRNPTAPMVYTNPDGKSYVLPPNTAMSMSALDMHFNSDIFSNPNEFRPERWLNSDAQELAMMNKYLMPFGRGARICLGMELAKQEILLVAGNLFWKYEMELHETKWEDMECVCDFFGAFTRSESKGLWIKVKGA